MYLLTGRCCCDQESEEELPVCRPWSVCSKVDMYESPWIERQCRCPGAAKCSSSLSTNDGHTLSDKTRHFKVTIPALLCYKLLTVTLGFKRDYGECPCCG